MWMVNSVNDIQECQISVHKHAFAWEFLTGPTGFANDRHACFISPEYM